MEWGLSRCLPTDGAEEEAAGGMPGPARLRRSAEMCLISTDIIWRPQTALPFSGGAEISVEGSGEEELEVFSSRIWSEEREGGLERERRGELYFAPTVKDVIQVCNSFRHSRCFS